MHLPPTHPPTPAFAGAADETGVLNVTVEDPAPGKMAIYTDHGATAVAAHVNTSVANAAAAASGGRPSSGRFSSPVGGAPGRPYSMDRSALQQQLPSAVAELLSRDPLADLSTSDMSLLWSVRYTLASMPAALPKFLRSVPWANRDAVAEAHALVAAWAPLPPEVALQLLDSHFPDPKVRAHAVAALESWGDDALAVFCLQLTQVSRVLALVSSAVCRHSHVSSGPTLCCLRALVRRRRC